MIEESCYKYMREIHNEILIQSKSAKIEEDVNLRIKLHEALQTLKSIENQETIIFIGGDKSGKSTLINHFLSNPLVVTGPTNREVISIAKQNDCAGPAIDMKAHHQVRGPTVWTNNKLPGKKVLVEFPGFGKFSSVDQEKFNHLIAPVIYCSVKQAKLVLVWNASDILTGRFREYLEQVKFLENLFDKHLASLIPGISVVFTHVPDAYGKQQVSMDHIVKCINQFRSSNQLVSPLAKKFLQEISLRSSKHGVFKRPIVRGPLTSRLEPSVRQSLLNDNYITFHELAYTLFAVIPLSTSIFSQELVDTIGAETFAMLDDAVGQIVKGAINDDEKTAEELNAQKQRLTNYRQSVREGLQSHVSIRKKIEILASLDASLKRIVQESQLYRKLEMAKVVKNSIRLAMRRLSVIDKAMNHLLSKVYAESELMVQNIDLQLRVLREVDAACELKNQNEKLEKEAVKLMNKINLMRRNEQKKKGFLFRIFRRDRVVEGIFDLLRFCTEPVLNRLLRLTGVQYVANELRTGLLLVTDIIERERIATSS